MSRLPLSSAQLFAGCHCYCMGSKCASVACTQNPHTHTHTLTHNLEHTPQSSSQSSPSSSVRHSRHASETLWKTDRTRSHIRARCNGETHRLRAVQTRAICALRHNVLACTCCTSCDDEAAALFGRCARRSMQPPPTTTTTTRARNACAESKRN